MTSALVGVVNFVKSCPRFMGHVPYAGHHCIYTQAKQDSKTYNCCIVGEVRVKGVAEGSIQLA